MPFWWRNDTGRVVALLRKSRTVVLGIKESYPSLSKTLARLAPSLMCSRLVTSLTLASTQVTDGSPGSGVQFINLGASK